MPFHIDEIRKLFSKCSVAVSPSLLVASISEMNCMGIDDFPNKDGENNRACSLASLIDNSRSFSVRIDQKKSIAFRFSGDFPVDAPAVYPRLEDPLNLDELDEFLLESIRTSKTQEAKEFAEFFMDTDLSDETALVKRFSEYMDMKEPKHTTVDLSSLDRWKTMLAALKDIDKAGFICEREINKPNLKLEYYGSILFFLNGKGEEHKDVVFDRNIKDALVKMIRIASLTEFELSVENGICNLVFYA